MSQCPSEIKIRYNTQSDGNRLKWRVIVNGTQHLVDEVCIHGIAVSTKDFMGEEGMYKHHITVHNAIFTDLDGVAHIVSYERSNGIKRDVIKTFSYRIFGSLASATVGYFATGSYSIGMAVGIGDLLIKPFIYFIHERVWRKIR